MRFFATIVAAAALVGATPTPAQLAPRACTTVTPDVFITFTKQNPLYSSPGGLVLLNRTGGAGSNVAKAGFTFNNVPAGATGCQLQFRLPAITQPNQFATGANTVNVFGVQSPITYQTTWNNPPVLTTQWGSINIPEWTTGATETIVASNTCSSSVSYEIELADWQQNAGLVEFYNSGFDRSPPNQGFFLVYNC